MHASGYFLHEVKHSILTIVVARRILFFIVIKVINY
jgi:hypothetical protein